MTSDDPTEGNTAVEEAPTTIETPPVEDSTESPEGAAPPSDQEQPESKEEGVSGDQKVEDEAPTQEAIIAEFVEGVEDNPALKAALEKKFTKTPEDVATLVLDQELAQSAQVRTATYQQANAQSQRYSPDNTTAAVEGVLDTLNGLMLDSAKELHEGKIEDPNRLQVDSRAWAKEHFAPIIQGAQASARTLAYEEARMLVAGALEKHASHRSLSGEDRTKYRAAIQANQLGLAVDIQLSAASRSAPGAKESAEAQKAEANTSLADSLKGVLGTMGKNGKKPTGAGTVDDQSDKDKLLDINTPVAELVEIRNRQRE